MNPIKPSRLRIFLLQLGKLRHQAATFPEAPDKWQSQMGTPAVLHKGPYESECREGYNSDLGRGLVQRNLKATRKMGFLLLGRVPQ